MREAKLALYHHDCWTSKLLEKFPGIDLRVISPISITNHTKSGLDYSFLCELRFKTEEEFKNYWVMLQKTKEVSTIKKMYKEGGKALLSIRGSMVESAYEAIINKNCTHLSNLQLKSGYELYHILAEDPKAIPKLLSELEEMGEVKILRIGKYRQEENPLSLTDKQKNALMLAMAYDYYTWPRSITLEELSKVAKVSRRTFHDNLRKAESKVFPKVVRDMIR